MASKYEIPPEFPERLHIQTISYCNGRCLFCAYPRVVNKITHGIMEDEVFKKIIDEAALYKPKRVALLLMNEPLLDRKLPKRIAYAKEKLGEGTEVTITSNGSILTEKIINRLIDSGLDRIKISVQGITKETYEKIMGLNYERTFEGIYRLAEIKKRRKSERPQIVLSMVNVGHNENEIRKYKRFFRRKGIKATSVAFENKGGNIEDSLELAPFGMKLRRRCYRFNRCAYIIFNGDVILCCADWTRSVILGNVKENSLKEIWLGEKITKIRENFLNGNYEMLPEICQNCKKTRLSLRSHRTLKGIYHKFLSYFQNQRKA